MVKECGQVPKFGPKSTELARVFRPQLVQPGGDNSVQDVVTTRNALAINIHYTFCSILLDSLQLFLRQRAIGFVLGLPHRLLLGTCRCL